MPDMPVPAPPPGMDMSALATAPSAPSGDALAPAGGSPLMAPQDMLGMAQATADRRQQTMAPMHADVQGAIGDYQRTAAAGPPKQQAPPEPQKGVGMEAAANWIIAATVLGAIGGAMTRRHTTNALAAFTGAIDGLREGNQQKFEQGYKTWEQENKRIAEVNKQQDQAYQQILADKKLAIDEKMRLVQLKAIELRDDQTAQVAGMRDYITLAQLLDKRAQALQQGSAGFRGARNASGMQRMLDDAAVDAKVEQIKAGIPTAQVMRGLGRADIAAINNKFAASGGNAADMMKAQTQYTGEQSYQRAAGTQSARVESATNEVQQLLPQAVEASRNLPRGRFVPLNELIQMGQKATSNPQYNDFLLANFSLAKAYGRAMNPQGVPRVAEAQEAHAMGVLSMATSPEAYEVQLNRLWLEVQASKRATAQTREGRQPENANAPGLTPAPPNPSRGQGSPSGLPQGWSIEEIK